MTTFSPIVSKEDSAKYPLRLPPTLYAVLREQAAERGTSVNTLIVQLLVKGTRWKPQEVANKRSPRAADTAA